MVVVNMDLEHEINEARKSLKESDCNKPFWKMALTPDGQDVYFVFGDYANPVATFLPIVDVVEQAIKIAGWKPSEVESALIEHNDGSLRLDITLTGSFDVN